MKTFTLGQRIKYARTFVNLTQGDIARRMGLAPATISHWEADRRTIGREQLTRFTKACNMSLEWFWLLNGRR